MLELKKFFFIVALRLFNDKEGKFKTIENGTTYFQSPFPAPPIISKAWDEFILYSENYEIFCLTVFGGWLDKPVFAS